MINACSYKNMQILTQMPISRCRLEHSALGLSGGPSKMYLRTFLWFAKNLRTLLNNCQDLFFLNILRIRFFNKK